MFWGAISRSPRASARLAGLLYLLPFAPFALLYVPSVLVVPGDAAVTAHNIAASEALFRLGILAELINSVTFILIAVIMYELLAPVDRGMALLMLIFNLVAVPIAMLDELAQFAVLEVLHPNAALSVAFSPDQLTALVPFFLDLHALGIGIAQIFWGLWLFPMGYLILRSGFLPRFIGVLLMIACVGYVLESLREFVVPSLNMNIALYTSWGELLLALWLLIKGVDVDRWRQRALAGSPVALG
jgi:ethanolamine utilization microcompartment shell protein EutS